MNIVSRSFAETKSNMPPSENRISGYVSVVPGSRRAWTRSISVPAVTAADATNAPPRSTRRSATSSSATAPSTISAPCRNNAGPSTATARSAVIVPRLVAVNPVALRITKMKAAISAPKATNNCGNCRVDRGANASMSTPTSAAPSRIRIAGTDLGQRRLDGGVDDVGHWLRVEAEQQDERDQRRHNGDLAAGEVLAHRRYPLQQRVDRALRGALHHPQHVRGRQDHAERRDDRDRLVDRERSDQHEELADERRRSRQRQRREPGEQEDTGEHRNELARATEVADVRRAATGHEHADDQEQQAGGETVVDHVQHRTGTRLRGEREDADADEAEVSDRRIRDQPLQVVLTHC